MYSNTPPIKRVVDRKKRGSWETDVIVLFKICSSLFMLTCILTISILMF